MPLWGLIYFATLYQDYVKDHGYNLYGSRMIELPFPNYAVFYNGNTPNLAEYDEQKTIEYIRREKREMGEQIGQAREEQIGQIKGEALLSELIARLLSDNRLNDIHLETSSKKKRKHLYREYGLLE